MATNAKIGKGIIKHIYACVMWQRSVPVVLWEFWYDSGGLKFRCYMYTEHRMLVGMNTIAN